MNIFDILHYRVYNTMPMGISIEADESVPHNFKLTESAFKYNPTCI